ncbi:MAG: exodeoxyribonuclease VII small subunit [Clostridiales bacterium]|jgi:exodeoxyribonuclease VII small subunit|nr:exodeoxyribonuclease VII small subunit [Clostridiales bacterium]
MNEFCENHAKFSDNFARTTQNSSGFDEKLVRLERIVETLDGGETLERTVELYAEGSRLADELKAALAAADSAVRVIRVGEGGEIIEQPFDRY